MKKFFRFLIRFIAALIIPALIVGSFFLFRPWYERQINKAKGVYYVYQGDKALQKSRDKKENVSKQLSNAVKYYKKGLEKYPEHYQARCNLANIYVLFEDYSSAIQEYRTALRYKPDYLECRMNLGILEADELSRYDEAISQYSEVTKSDKKGVNIPYIYDSSEAIKENKINAYYNTGLAYRGKTMFTRKDRLKNNQYLKEAVQAYNKAAEAYNKAFKGRKDKNSYDILYNLALTHHHLGNTKQAGLNYCKAIEASPMSFEAHLNLAILLDSIDRHKEAIEEYNKAGLLINDGDKETILYLNDLLNESYKKYAIMNKQDSEEEEIETFAPVSIYIKDGKPVFKEEKESEFKKTMKNCASKKIFEDEM